MFILWRYEIVNIVYYISEIFCGKLSLPSWGQKPQIKKYIPSNKILYINID